MEFERTFDNAAAQYDAVRPEYPRALYQDLFRRRPLTPESQVLEIGLGTGKAAEPVLRTGCRFVGLEPGACLAAIAGERLKSYRNFTLLPQTFQELDCPGGSFDLIYAATAFHWIPEEYGYRRVYELLKPGGVFARFAYHAGPDQKRTALTAEVYQLYRRYMHGGKGEYRALTPADGPRLLAVPEKYGFKAAEFRLYHMEKDFTPEEYRQLLQTYRDHMALEEENRNLLFDGICQAIRRHGGIMTVFYTVDLQLAEKPESQRI